MRFASSAELLSLIEVVLVDVDDVDVDVVYVDRVTPARTTPFFLTDLLPSVFLTRRGNRNGRFCESRGNEREESTE